MATAAPDHDARPAPALAPAVPRFPGDAAGEQRASLVRIVRMAFVVMMMTVTLLYILNVGESRRATGNFTTDWDPGTAWHIPLTAGILLLLLVLAIDMLTPRKKIATISGVFFGLLVGLLATWAMSYIVDLLVAAYEIKADNLVSTIKVLVGISLCYLGMSVVLQTQDDFRLIIPYVEFAKQLRGPRPLILDTSALIDARVVDLAATGIFAIPLVIPRFVIDELQQLADSGEKLKRTRGRRGLEAIGKLQRIPGIDLSIDESPVVAKAVDQMLVELARAMPGAIVTADAALNRVAAIRGVTVLNLNDIANALKPSLIPGTRLSLRLIRKGEQPGQAIGYLDDGTMVVAENAEHFIERDADLEVNSALQTSAGRLIFAKLTSGTQVASPEPHSPAPGPDAGSVLPPGDSDAPSLTSDWPAPPHQGPPPAPRTSPPEGGPIPPRPFPQGRPQRSNAPRNPRR